MHTELLDLAISIARDAGELAARRRREGVQVADTKSTAVDIVTEADREVERLIRSRIGDARPDDAILGEEGGSVGGTTGLMWVVDPIDGTTNYLYGIPHYAVSVAVVEGDDPRSWDGLVGVVYNPATGELFSAERGKGAWITDAAGGGSGTTRIRIPAPAPFDQWLIGTGFAYAADMRAVQGALVTQLLPQVRDIRRAGTASLDLAFVAAGRLDAFYERTLSPWDHAAGAVIVREAGGVVKGRGDDAPGRDLVLAGHPEVVARLEAELERLGVDAPRLDG